MAARVRKGDLVSVRSGRDAGKEGKVLRVDPALGRVIVEGVNMVKRHTRPNQKSPQGGIVEKEAPIAVSKVMPIDPKTKKPTRIGHLVVTEKGEERKVRVSRGKRASGEALA